MKEIDLLIKFLDANPMVLFVLVFFSLISLFDL